MVAFSSRREKRLWISVVVTGVLILSSSILAPSIAAWLRSEGLLTVMFVGAFVVAILALAVLAKNVQLRGVELGVLLGVIACLVFAAVRINLPEERSHLIEYSVFAALLFEAVRERWRSIDSIWASAWKSALAATMVGLLDEVIQLLVPGRVFDVRDLCFNLGAVIGGIGLVGTVARSRLKNDRSGISDLESIESSPP